MMKHSGTRQATMIAWWYVALTVAALGLAYLEQGVSRLTGAVIIAAYAAYTVAVLLPGAPAQVAVPLPLEPGPAALLCGSPADGISGQATDILVEVKAIGVSGQQHGFVPLDAKGEVIRPAKLWCDTSTTAECDIITEKLGGFKKTISALGNAMLPGFTAPKILWLKRHEPANYRRLATVLLPHDYLNFWLTGERVMEYGDASGTVKRPCFARLLA